MTNIAAIDIGSNAIRLVIASISKDNTYQIIHSKRESIRLGKEVFSSGKISQQNLQKCAVVFADFKNILESFSVKLYRAVATSALRDASNKKDFIKEISKSSGIKIEIISGLEEARLTTLAVTNKVNLKNKLALLVDIGGGSTEISIALNGEIISSDSMNMGTVRFLQILEDKKRASDIFNRLVKSYASALKRRIKKDIGKKEFNILVATGGTVSHLGVVGKTHFGEEQTDKITVKTLKKIQEVLQLLSIEDRVLKYNLKPDRADVILPAITMLCQISKQIKSEELFIPETGLKEGVLLDLISSQKEISDTKLARDKLLSFSLKLGEKYAFDEEHAKSVSALALQIFDRTQKLHELDKESRVLLEMASLLHDIGDFINIDGHHKHSYYIISSANFLGLSHVNKMIVACITKYHRKSVPKMEHIEYSSLPLDARKKVRILSAILRVAEILGSFETDTPLEIKFYIRPPKVLLKIFPKTDLLFKKYLLRSQVVPLEKALNIKLMIR